MTNTKFSGRTDIKTNVWQLIRYKLEKLFVALGSEREDRKDNDGKLLSW